MSLHLSKLVPITRFQFGEVVNVKITEAGQPDTFRAVICSIRVTAHGELDYTVQDQDGGKSDGYTEGDLLPADLERPTKTPRTDADSQWCDVGSGEQEELCLASTARQLEVELLEARRKLPHTKDGVPIFLGDEVFIENRDTSYWEDEDEIMKVVVTAINLDCECASYEGDFTIGCEGIEAGNLDFYSSDDALNKAIHGIVEKAEHVKCPNCLCEAIRESVDVGVGLMHGPWGCPCGWSEDGRYNTIGGPKFTEHGGLIDPLGGVWPAESDEAKLAKRSMEMEAGS